MTIVIISITLLGIIGGDGFVSSILEYKRYKDIMYTSTVAQVLRDISGACVVKVLSTTLVLGKLL